MPSFSDKSLGVLWDCDKRLQDICHDAIEIYDFTVLEGFRSNQRQDELYRAGKSKLRAGQSKHNRYPSAAVDLAPFPIDWADSKRFFLLAGIMFAVAEQHGVKLTWGGDWDGDWSHSDQTFHDLPHFEIKE